MIESWQQEYDRKNYKRPYARREADELRSSPSEKHHRTITTYWRKVPCQKCQGTGEFKHRVRGFDLSTQERYEREERWPCRECSGDGFLLVVSEKQTEFVTVSCATCGKQLEIGEKCK